jgi:hypothetical protein
MLKRIIVIITFSILCFGCGDDAPTVYTPITVVEALLIVDKPIQEIRITKTLPLTELYDYNKSIIKDAKVFIYEDEEEFELVFHSNNSPGNKNFREIGYYYPDTNYLVKPNTTYHLKIILPDETIVTGTTTTPDSITWVRRIPQFIQYPFDTVKMPLNIIISPEWTSSKIRNAFYILSVTCLDTLEYGRYLSEPTNELNRRVYPPRRHERSYRELSSYSVAISTWTPVWWNVFKWFGHHSFKVYVPDRNYEMWYANFQWAGELSERAYSVDGCAGFFGSAFVLEDNTVLLKNQP